MRTDTMREGNTWTREKCEAALQQMPARLRMNDAWDYCRKAGLGKHRGGALWAALRRHGLIERTDMAIGTSPNRCYWRMAIPKIVNNGASQQERAESIMAEVSGQTVERVDLRVFGEGTKTQRLHFQAELQNGRTIVVRATGNFTVELFK